MILFHQDIGNIVTVTAKNSSIDTAWFIKINKLCTKSENEEDNYGHQVKVDIQHIHAQFCEKRSRNKGHLYWLCGRTTLTYKDSISYVQITEAKNGLISIT